MAPTEKEIRFHWTPEIPTLSGDPPHRLHVLVSADAPSVQHDRTPVNLSLVLDRSGSMRGGKLRYTLESALILIDHLAEQDRLSIVFYGSEVETVLPPTPVGDRESIRRVLKGIRAKGTTNLSGGWLQGIRLVEKSRLKGGANRVLLMTDGLANRGIIDTPSLTKLAEKSRKKKIITTTLGFGKGFNEDLLTAIATASGGNFHFIENPDDAPRAFATELGELMGLAAQNLQGKIRFAEGVRFLELLNTYPSSKEGQNLEVFPGDVFSGEKRTILFSLEVDSRGEGEQNLFSAQFEYDDLSAGGESKRTGLEAAIPFGSGGRGEAKKAEEVVLAVGLYRVGEAKRKAKRLADKGEMKDGAKLLEEALRSLDSFPDRPEIVQERKELRLFADELRKSSWNAADRKSLSASIFRSQIGRISVDPDKRDIADTRVEKKDS
ncbi:MAG: vWA domain-containing protein [Planctomycetota bacterium]|jgi:Ca-activated chloride channel family protein